MRSTEGTGTAATTHATIAQAAREVGVHDQTLRRLANEGVIREVRIGRTVRIPHSEVERLRGLIEEQRRGVRQEEAARRLGVSALTIARAIRSGEIPAKRNLVGRGGFFIDRDVFERLCRGEVSGGAEAS